MTIKDAIERHLKGYEKLYRYTGFEQRFGINSNIFLLIGFAAAFLLFAVGNVFDIMIGVLLSLIAVDFALGYPYYARDARVSAIEAKFPDVLHHMGTTIKAGGSIEAALRDASKAQYGPITFEIKTMLRELNEGKTFDDALIDMGERTGSRIVKRSATIIVTAKRAGGGLVETLSSIAEDARDAYRIAVERKTRTMMQVLFLVIAGVLVAPGIFGLVFSIMNFMATINPEQKPSEVFYTIGPIFKVYLLVEGMFVAAVVAIMREGRFAKAVIYAPAMLLIIYTVYTLVSAFAIKWFLGG